MPDWFAKLSDGFMPHGYCLQWNASLLFVFIAGNIGIAIAYFLIPAALRMFIGKRRDLPYPYMFKMFAVFILSCGVTHLAKVWTIYHADYWIEATIDMWTAAVSLATAVMLFPLIPKALSLRSPRELEESNQELAAARDEAVRANQLKSQFVANISHEIRTPMTAILGLTELISLETEGEVHDMADHVFLSAKALMSLVNDLLDISKLEAGRLDINLESFKIEEVIGALMTSFQIQASSKDIKLKSHVDESIKCNLKGDRLRVQQILQNLLQNAIKFTEQGEIEVSARLEKIEKNFKWVRFEVRDTGAGITPEDQRKLFQLFVQVDGSTTRRHGGTGLGLALCKRLGELMGGSIGVTSELGAGSTFWLLLPFEEVTG